MDQVSQIRDKIDIVALISEYVSLKKSGRNFVARCPFHTEKTPSFVVSPDRQIWHCFGGCSKGGDAYSFVMEYEKIDFPEALSILAKKAGIELVRSQFATGTGAKKERLYGLNHLTSEFYHYLLVSHPVGKQALEYLVEKRGLTKALMNTFMVGFAPNVGNPLSSYLIKKKGYTPYELSDAGVSIVRGNSLIDFFKGRIMFPLIDHRGNVVGFSGRVLEESGSGPKYINTKDTLIYHKGSHFFGIHTAKEEIKKENKAIIVEGEFDVISCFKEGIGNAIAVKGTALTEEQVALIARFAQRISLCFDADKAGEEALKRSLGICEKKGLSISVVPLVHGKDADEAIKRDPVIFKKAVKRDTPVYDFLFDKLFANTDVASAEGKRGISGTLLPLLAQISNAIIKEHYVKRLGDELNTSFESINQELERIEKKSSIATSPVLSSKIKRSREDVLEEYLTSLILQHDAPVDLINDIQWENAVAYAPRDSSYQKIIRFLIKETQQGYRYESKSFAKRLPKELHSAFDTCFLYPLVHFSSPSNHTKEAQKTSRELKTLFVKSAIQHISDQLKHQEKEGHVDEALSSKLQELTSLLK